MANETEWEAFCGNCGWSDKTVALPNCCPECGYDEEVGQRQVAKEILPEKG